MKERSIENNDLILECLNEAGFGCDDCRISSIVGGASSKSFYRVNINNHSMIAMINCSFDTDFFANPISVPEDNPFVLIGSFLKAKGVSVPEIYFYIKDKNFILVEDLGEYTLADKLPFLYDINKREILNRCVDVIDSMQRIDLESVKDIAFIYDRLMDDKTIYWEFCHYLECYLKDKCNADLSAHELKELEEFFLKLTNELVNSGKVLSHRDYHSKNLMISDSSHVSVIDFQDLALASPLYDLSSLLYDANLNDVITETLRSQAFDYWCSLNEVRLVDKDHARRLLDVQGLQRCLKGIGRFCWLERNWNNKEFVKLIPNAMNLVYDICSKREDMSNFREIVEKYSLADMSIYK